MTSHRRIFLYFRHRTPRRGLSIFEVLLALAILAGGVAVLGELSRNAARNAVRTGDLTEAQLVCESVLAELAAGVIEPTPVQQMPYANSTDWLYSVTLDRDDLEGLVSATVTVEKNDASMRSVTFSLVRWIPDPGIEIPDDPEDERQATGNNDSTDDDSSGDAANGSSAIPNNNLNSIPSGGIGASSGGGGIDNVRP